MLSAPPIDPCGTPFCQPWPVCWLMNALCRNGFVLPVGFGWSGAAAGGCNWPGATEFLANGLVPVRWGWIGCKLPWDCGRFWGANGLGAPLKDGGCGLCFAKGLVFCRCRGVAGAVGNDGGGEGALSAGGSMDCRNGLFARAGPVCIGR